MNQDIMFSDRDMDINFLFRDQSTEFNFDVNELKENEKEIDYSKEKDILESNNEELIRIFTHQKEIQSNQSEIIVKRKRKRQCEKTPEEIQNEIMARKEKNKLSAKRSREKKEIEMQNLRKDNENLKKQLEKNEDVINYLEKTIKEKEMTIYLQKKEIEKLKLKLSKISPYSDNDKNNVEHKENEDSLVENLQITQSPRSTGSGNTFVDSSPSIHSKHIGLSIIATICVCVILIGGYHKSNYGKGSYNTYSQDNNIRKLENNYLPTNYYNGTIENLRMLDEYNTKNKKNLAEDKQIILSNDSKHMIRGFKQDIFIEKALKGQCIEPNKIDVSIIEYNNEVGVVPNSFFGDKSYISLNNKSYLLLSYNQIPINLQHISDIDSVFAQIQTYNNKYHNNEHCLEMKTIIPVQSNGFYEIDSKVYDFKRYILK